MIKKSTKNSPPIVSIAITIGLNMSVTFCLAVQATHDFHSKYEPPPDIGIKSSMRATDAVPTPQ